MINTYTMTNIKDNKIFIDTGAYLARFHKRDRMHEISVKIWDILKTNTSIITYTTNHVIDELATLLARRTSYDFSGTKLQEIYKSKYPIIFRPGKEDEKESIKIFYKYSDQQISFTDCLSFVVMKKLGIKQVFTFDKHFQYDGFAVIP